MDINDKKAKYFCALFSDGYMIVNNTWIKKKIDENNYEVYVPPAQNASTYVSKALSKKIIHGWECMSAEIKCDHDSLLEARKHIKELSESDSEIEDAVRNENTSNFNNLENAARVACGIDDSNNEKMSDIPLVDETSSALTDSCDDDLRALSSEIDAAKDIDGIKKVLKQIVDRMIIIKQNPGSNDENISLDKISSVQEFMKFTTKLANDGGFAKSIVNRWKNLRVASTSQQQPLNAKVYGILLDLFDKNFLAKNVQWGRMRSSAPFNDSMIYLKLHDDFVDTIKEVLDIKISPDTTRVVGELFKSNLRNKLKRDIKMKQGEYKECKNKAKKSKND